MPTAGCRGSLALGPARGGGAWSRLDWQRVAAAWDRAPGGAREMAHRMSAAVRVTVTSARSLERGAAQELRRRPRSSAASTSTIATGERHAIIGPNGAGKSTLFNLISGLLPADVRRTIRLNGAADRGLPPYKINRRGLSRSLPGHQHLSASSACGRTCAARCCGRSGEKYTFWRVGRQPPEIARAHPAGAGRYQPDRAQGYAGGRPHLCRAARARDRHHHGGWRRRHPARRADRRHEPRRDRARRRPDPPHQRGAHARDRRARHERRVRPRRPHLGARLRRDHRQRHARPRSAATPRSRKPISGEEAH